MIDERKFGGNDATPDPCVENDATPDGTVWHNLPISPDLGPVGPIVQSRVGCNCKEEIDRLKGENERLKKDNVALKAAAGELMIYRAAYDDQYIGKWEAVYASPMLVLKWSDFISMISNRDYEIYKRGHTIAALQRDLEEARGIVKPFAKLYKSLSGYAGYIAVNMIGDDTVTVANFRALAAWLAKHNEQPVQKEDSCSGK